MQEYMTILTAAAFGDCETLSNNKEILQPHKHSALGYACRYGGLDCVKHILDLCGDEDITQESYGVPYVPYAMMILNECNMYKYWIATPFIRIKKTFTHPDSKSKRVKMLSREKRMQIIDYMLGRGLSLSWLLYCAIIVRDTEIVDVLYKAGTKLPESVVDALYSKKSSSCWEHLYWYSKQRCTNFCDILAACENIVKVTGKTGLHCSDSFIQYNAHLIFSAPETFERVMRIFNRSCFNTTAIMREIVNREDVPMLEMCAEVGLLERINTVDSLLTTSVQCNHTEITAWLMNYRNSKFDIAKIMRQREQRAMRALMASPDSITVLRKTWTWKKCDDGTICITKYKKNDDVVSVPEVIAGCPVTSIGADAFYKGYLDGVAMTTKIILPKTIKSIGSWAFAEQSQLQSINLPKGLEEIGKSAFGCCTSLVEVEIPSTVKALPCQTFLGCKNLASVKLHEGLEEIGEMAFDGCPMLKDINIPRSVKCIETLFATDQHTQVHYVHEKGVEDI